jgi:hypothetical protein
MKRVRHHFRINDIARPDSTSFIISEEYTLAGAGASGSNPPHDASLNEKRDGPNTNGSSDQEWQAARKFRAKALKDGCE